MSDQEIGYVRDDELVYCADHGWPIGFAFDDEIGPLTWFCGECADAWDAGARAVPG